MREILAGNELSMTVRQNLIIVYTDMPTGEREVLYSKRELGSIDQGRLRR